MDPGLKICDIVCKTMELNKEVCCEKRYKDQVVLFILLFENLFNMMKRHFASMF